MICMVLHGTKMVDLKWLIIQLKRCNNKQKAYPWFRTKHLSTWVQIERKPERIFCEDGEQQVSDLCREGISQRIMTSPTCLIISMSVVTLASQRNCDHGEPWNKPCQQGIVVDHQRTWPKKGGQNMGHLKHRLFHNTHVSINTPMIQYNLCFPCLHLQR